MKRAKQEPFLVELNSQSDNLNLDLIIVYSVNTSKVYSVKISREPTCTCPYFTLKKKCRQQICKHIIWVYLSIVNLPENTTLIFQTSLTSNELQMVRYKAPKFVPVDLRRKNDKQSLNLTELEIEAMLKKFDGEPQLWKAIKLQRESTANCAGCHKSKMIKGRICVTAFAKFIPRNTAVVVDRTFYFCALLKCIRNIPARSNLKPPAAITIDVTLSTDDVNILRERNLPV